MQFALVDNAILMDVQEFDWIFDGEDVNSERLVDEVDDRGQCRGLGGLPGEKNRSLIFADFRSIAASRAGVENGAGAGALAVAD